MEATEPALAVLESSTAHVATDPASGPAERTLGYQPALDGLRGVAVLAVMLFHAGLPWASGGYLGVSVFFTLSGFLITRLMLEEASTTGRVGFARFYGRRIRRLVPASVLTLSGIVVLAHAGAFPPLSDLHHQVVGAALQLGNWAQLSSTGSYADLFGSQASPVDHYWSLAIEEQFYLLWPLVLAPLVVRSVVVARRAVLVLFVLFALLAPAIAVVWGTDAVYLSTPSRIAEILAGAALAVMIDPSRVPSAVRAGAIAASITVLAAMVITPVDHGWAYRGGLPLFALASATVVAGALGAGPVRSVLAWRPLVALGVISYSVYLVHWPLFMLVDTQLPAMGRWAALTLKLALTVAVAATVYLVVERQFRTVHLRPTTIPIGLAAMAVTATIAVAVAPAQPPELARASTGLDRPAAPEPTEVDALEPVSPGAASAPATTMAPLPDPARIMVVGDSTGDVIGAGLVAWANANPTLAQVEVRSVPGCGLATGGRFDNAIDGERERCDRATQDEIPTSWLETTPDVVVISIAVADTWNRRWDDGPVLRATDPAYADRIRAGYDAFFDRAAAAGVPHVVWLRPPIVGLEPRYYDPSFVDGSQEVVEAVVRHAAERHPTMITMLDYRSWFEDTSLPDDPRARPDGVHLAPAAALQVATDYLGPQLTQIAR